MTHKLSKTLAQEVLLWMVLSALVLSLGVIASPAQNAQGSSHREAPLISADPKADATDLYAFVSPDNPNTVTLIANYLPFQEPAGGPNFYNFDDSVLYEIKIDNNGDAVEDVTYQFRFTTKVQNGNTFLYNTGPIESLTDPDFNVRQTYTLTKIEAGTATVLGQDIAVPPANVGPKSTPNYANLQAQAVQTVADGVKTFAGQINDPFFVELGGLFDLLTIRKLPGNSGGGTDGLAGFNTNTLALQIPIEKLTKNKDKPTDFKNPDAVIGVWTTASRQSTRVLSPGANNASGDWVQISRLGNPLVNEVVVPLAAKDIWNGSKPVDDAQFANGATDPELGKLLKALYNVQVPPQGAFGTPEARDDLVAIFLTGISGLTQPANVKPSEQLRLNVAVPPSTNLNRMGVLGGDNAGYPNGRRIQDDVTDIAIQAVAGAAYKLFHPDFSPDPLATQLGDGVAWDDAAPRANFPYTALPNSGFDSFPHGGMGNGNNGNGNGNGNGTPPPVGNGYATLYRLYNARIDNHFYTTSMSERDAAVRGGYRDEGSIGNVSVSQIAGSAPLFRLYSKRLNNHFYTTSESEKDAAVRGGFVLEGTIGYVQMQDNGKPLYRLFNARSGNHLYTTSSGERDQAASGGYASEGPAGYLY